MAMINNIIPMHGMYCPVCRYYYTWPSTEPRPKCPSFVRRAIKERRDIEAEVNEALDLAEKIDALADQVPMEGEEFAESVRDKADDIAANIQANRRVTDKQRAALENMLEGLQRWVHD